MRPIAALTGIVAVAACAHLPAPAPEIPLRVMTYNIRFGNNDLGGIAQAIRASSPDLVALQEVDVHWAARSGFVDEATTLSQQLGMEMRFARIYQLAPTRAGDPPREFGVAVLSKFPVKYFRNHMITRLSTQDTTAAAALAPGFLEARVDVRGTSVRVFDTHLDYRADPRVRRQQVAEMLQHIGESPEPTLLFGDLNAPPDAPEIQPLFRKLRDAWPGANGPGLTDPADVPVTRIDYVLPSSRFRVRSASVPATLASDHRPVVMDLVLTP